MNVVLPHSLTYNVAEDVPVSLVAKSLVAHEQMIQESLRLLEGILPGLEVGRISVRVAELGQQSPLKELFLVALVIAFQEDLQREVPDLIQKLTDVDVPDNTDTLVTVLVLMLAAYIVDRAVRVVLPDKKTKRLRREYELKRAELARMAGVTEDAIDDALDRRLTQSPPPRLVQRARDVLMPAKVGQNGEILVPRGTGISMEAIREVPDDLDYALAKQPSSYERANVTIEIHRADRDEIKHGWRAIIPDISDKKVRMELAPDIAPSSLYGRTSLVGDVLVEEGPDASGVVDIRTYHLIRVLGTSAPVRRRKYHRR